MEGKILKCFKRNLLGAAGIPKNMSLPLHDFFDFGWIQSSGCSLHHQDIVDIVARNVTRISFPWWCKRKSRSLMEGNRQSATRRKLKILSHTHDSESNSCLFSRITSFFGMHGWLMPIQLLCVTSYLTYHSAVIMAVEAHTKNMWVTVFMPECVWWPVMWATSHFLCM